MSVEKIASRLVELCRLGHYETAQRELYADDAVSIEHQEMPGLERETHGLEGLIKKGHIFESMVETIHGGEVSEPMFAGNAFAITMSLDATWKNGQRTNSKELCVYEIKDGKIINEEFFS